MTDAAEIIQGNRYIFQIQFGNCKFAIKAQCKLTKRYSHINNLNVILSEFGIDIDDQRIAESTWEVTADEVSNLANIAEAFLKDVSFLHYIEKQLDLDRELGEWENMQKNNWPLLIFEK